jgi:Cd2+/Zn2+-exporting ATPase
MLTGDSAQSAARVATELNIDDVMADKLPDQKLACLESVMDSRGHLGATCFVGDGVNDAPSLVRADVGISMGGIGSDAAIESADIVITSDNILRIHEAIKIASASLSIAKQNIAFALGVKLAIMVLAIFGIANMWLAVIADVGVAVLAILNSMRTLLYGRRTSE